MFRETLRRFPFADPAHRLSRRSSSSLNLTEVFSDDQRVLGPHHHGPRDRRDLRDRRRALRRKPPDPSDPRDRRRLPRSARRRRGLAGDATRRWLIPSALPVIGTLWTSVSASTRGWRGAARVEAQDRFWWLNHLAITSGAIAGVRLPRRPHRHLRHRPDRRCAVRPRPRACRSTRSRCPRSAASSCRSTGSRPCRALADYQPGRLERRTSSSAPSR